MHWSRYIRQYSITTVAEKGHHSYAYRHNEPRAVKQRTANKLSHQSAQGQRSINHVPQSASIAKEYLESRYDLLT